MADGSIIIEATIDAKKAQKELNSLTQQIEKNEQSIEEMQKKRRAASEESVFKASELDAEKAKLQEIKDRLQEIRALSKDKSVSFESREEYKGQIPFLQEELSDQQTRVRELQNEFNKLDSSVQKYDEKLSDATEKLGRQKERAGELVQEISAVGDSSNRMAEAQEKAQKSAAKFASRLKSVVRSALVFTLITQALAKFRDWMSKTIRTNEEARAAFARLQGALLTLAQPLLEVVIPALITFVNILTQIVSAIAQLFSFLFGKTINQSKNAAKSLNAETKALEGVSSAAEEASGSLAGFDEINTIATETADGAGAGAGTEIQPDFDFETDMSEGQLKQLLGLIEAIGAALLAWKLSDGLTDGLKKFIGLLLAINGGIEFVRAALDAWTNGVNWDNLLNMLLRMAEMVAGLYIAFGKTGAAIGLVVSGLAMLAVGIHDALEQGWTLENLLTTISGIMATGAGIAILTGSWIPLLISGIASLLVAITVATGHGEELLNGIRTLLEGFKEFFTGVFTGDIVKALSGIGTVVEGLKTIANAVLDGIKDGIISFLDWLDEKTGGQFSSIIQFAKNLVSVWVETTRGMILGFLDGIQTAFQGLIKFISGVFTADWDLAWEGVKDIFKGVWNGIISIAENAVNLVVKGINWIISGIKKFTAFQLPDWMGGYSFEGISITPMSPISIPRLATGAVIPPNREFMAVLGDQRSGTNIEAPEDLIRKIVREESGGVNSEVVALLQAILQATKDGKTIMVGKTVLGRTAASAINDLTISSGKSVLLY